MCNFRSFEQKKYLKEKFNIKKAPKLFGAIIPKGSMKTFDTVCFNSIKCMINRTKLII